METKSIVICGVGGQGIILASDILSRALFNSGMDVKKNEIHGMSQREGSVVSFIRFGEKIFSPVVSDGEADFLLGFEKLEALRNIGYLKKDGCAVINDLEIPPTPVILGTAEYPKNISSNFREVTDSIHIVKALELSGKLGNSRTSNVLLLGVLSRYIENIELKVWIDSIKAQVKEAFLDINIKAFETGRNIKE